MTETKLKEKIKAKTQKEKFEKAWYIIDANGKVLKTLEFEVRP